MEVIDRYVHEIGEHLPWNLRADVEAELRSLLLDSLEERARAAERPPDPPLAEAVIREFGAPGEVAKRYLPQDQYLIGPRLFPAYRLVVKIALIVIAATAGGLFIAAIVGSAVANREGPDPLAVAHTIWQAAMGIFLNLALVTLVFAIIERVQARREATAPNVEPGDAASGEGPGSHFAGRHGAPDVHDPGVRGAVQFLPGVGGHGHRKRQSPFDEFPYAGVRHLHAAGECLLGIGFRLALDRALPGTLAAPDACGGVRPGALRRRDPLPPHHGAALVQV